MSLIANMNQDIFLFILIVLAALSLPAAIGAMMMVRRLWVQAKLDAMRIQYLEAQNAALVMVVERHYPNELSQAMQQAQASALGTA